VWPKGGGCGPCIHRKGGGGGGGGSGRWPKGTRTGGLATCVVCENCITTEDGFSHSQMSESLGW